MIEAILSGDRKSLIVEQKGSSRPGDFLDKHPHLGSAVSYRVLTNLIDKTRLKYSRHAISSPGIQIASHELFQCLQNHDFRINGIGFRT